MMGVIVLKAKKQIIIVFFLIFILFFYNAYISVQGSDPQKIDWIQTYGGEGADTIENFVKTSDDGYALIGKTTGTLEGDNDVWLIKVDSTGTLQWEKTFGNDEYDAGKVLIELSDEGYLLGGFTVSSTEPEEDMWIIKVDKTGKTQWSKTFGGNQREFLYDMISLSNGSFLLVGETNTYGSGSQDVWLVKIDKDGDLLWDHTYGLSGSGTERGYSIIQASGNSFIIVGMTNSQDDSNIWIIKIDETGTILWDKTYGGNGADYGKRIISSIDGGFVIAGTTGKTGSFDMWLIKIDSFGDKEWSRTYGNEGSEGASSVIQTKDGGYAIVGSIEDSFSSSDLILLKTDSNGIQEWNLTYGTEYSNEAKSVIETESSEFLIAGSITKEYGGYWRSEGVLLKTKIKNDSQVISFPIIPWLLALTVINKKRKKIN